MRTLSNSEDPDEMLHNVAFHHGLHCLLKKKAIFREIQFCMELITCEPLI